MKLKVFGSEVQQIHWEDKKKPKTFVRSSSVWKKNWVNLQLLSLRLSVCLLPALWFTIPSPVLPFTLVCLHDVTLSCSFLSLWIVFLTPAQYHVACTDPSPSLCLGHRSHFPLCSIRLHFRNYLQLSQEAENGRRGRADKRGLLWLAFSPTAAVLPDFCQ